MRDLAALYDAHRRLRWNAAFLGFVLAARRCLRKQFNPDQPRVPAGNPDGGQWTNAGGGGGLFTAGGLPRIPKLPPPTRRERNTIAKAVAVWLAEKGIAAGDFIARQSWLYEAYPYISAYLDGPKSLAELHELAQTPAKGYDIHHIVEQTPAAQHGYPRSLIDRGDNLVRIPTLKHWEINGWYQKRNDDFGGLSPREYLRYQDWDTRRSIGLNAMILRGVLRP